MSRYVQSFVFVSYANRLQDVGPSRREVSPDRKSVTTEPVGPAIPVAPAPAVPTPAALVTQAAPPPAAPASGPERHYVKTLRLTSDQLVGHLS